jgi:hypothetical protein
MQKQKDEDMVKINRKIEILRAKLKEKDRKINELEKKGGRRLDVNNIKTSYTNYYLDKSKNNMNSIAQTESQMFLDKNKSPIKSSKHRMTFKRENSKIKSPINNKDKSNKKKSNEITDDKNISNKNKFNHNNSKKRLTVIPNDNNNNNKILKKYTQNNIQKYKTENNNENININEPFEQIKYKELIVPKTTITLTENNNKLEQMNPLYMRNNKERILKKTPTNNMNYFKKYCSINKQNSQRHSNSIRGPNSNYRNQKKNSLKSVKVDLKSKNYSEINLNQNNGCSKRDKSDKSNNNSNSNNNIYLLNYNNKKYKFNKIRNTNPSKIKKNLKDIRASKQYLNSDNIKATKQELDFNICKFLVNNSHIKKNYKEFLSKKYGGNTVIHKKNNEANTINANSNNILSKNKNQKYDNSYKNNTLNYNSKSNDKKIYNQRTNYLSNYQNGVNNKGNNINVINKKNNFKKLQNYKKININNMISKDKIMSKSKNLSIINNNSKNKSKVLMVKSTQLSSKTKTINKSKRTNKLKNQHFFNQFSMELEFNSINNNLETDPNFKKRIKSINRLTKKYRTKVNSKINSNTENKKLNQNVNIKYSMNTLRKHPISNYNYSNKDNLDSPLKNGKYRQKLTKNHINNPSINSSHKKQFYTINNIVTNFKMYKPDLIATINKTNQKNISRQVKKPIKDEISNKLVEKNTKSIEINKNNRDSFFKVKIEKQNNLSGISSIYNLSNNDTLSNYLKNTDKTPNHYKENNLSKNSKNIRSQKSKNQILIICSECDLDSEKNKILKMNKYRNLCLKTNEDLKDINYYKKYRLKGAKKISNINNYKENILRIKKNNTQNNLGNAKHITFHTSRTHNKNLTIFYMNKKHIKYNSMRISDLYKNNIKNKKKEKKVYLIDKDKINEEQTKINTKNKFSLGNKALFPRNIISINNFDSSNDRSVQIKKSEKNI